MYFCHNLSVGLYALSSYSGKHNFRLDVSSGSCRSQQTMQQYIPDQTRLSSNSKSFWKWKATYPAPGRCIDRHNPFNAGVLAANVRRSTSPIIAQAPISCLRRSPTIDWSSSRSRSYYWKAESSICQIVGAVNNKACRQYWCQRPSEQETHITSAYSRRIVYALEQDGASCSGTNVQTATATSECRVDNWAHAADWIFMSLYSASKQAGIANNSAYWWHMIHYYTELSASDAK